MTASRLIRSAGLAAVVAGLLFVAIQPIHPPDTLASVTTSTWVGVHYATLVMTVLFVIGLAGIYARQVKETGWLGLAGFVLLSVGLLITAAFVFVEAFLSPLLAESQPDLVDGLLGMVSGTGGEAELGVLPALWTASGLLFLVGCLAFGLATLRAGILSRWASGLFALGLPVASVVVARLPADLHRLGAIPIGVGLAWLGYGLWAERGGQSAGLLEEGALPSRDGRRAVRAGS